MYLCCSPSRHQLKTTKQEPRVLRTLTCQQIIEPEPSITKGRKFKLRRKRRFSDIVRQFCVLLTVVPYLLV